MSVCLCDVSALVCLRNGFAAGERRERVACGQDLSCWPAQIPRDLARRLASSGVSTPCEGNELCLMASKREQGLLRGEGVVLRDWPRILAKESLIDGGEGILCLSPECLFLQMAERLDFVSLVGLGLELCGCYRMGTGGNGALFDISGVRLGCPPLTSTVLLRSYLSRSPETAGLKRARRAMDFVVDGVASPHAAVTGMLLCLPQTAGGYGLLMPCAGVGVLSTQRKGGAGEVHLTAQLLWPDARLGIECVTAEVPATPDLLRRAREGRRHASHNDMRRISLSAVDIADVATIHAVARQLARRLGASMPVLDKGYRETRFGLRERLMPIICAPSRLAWAA